VEKRLFLFVVLSLLIWGGYITLKIFLEPPKPLAVKKSEPKDKVENKQAEEKASALEKPEKPEKEPSVDTADVPTRAAVARQRLTLGSLDPKSGYTMLVTLDNRGAAIERIEFNDRFHDLDDLSGYLGHLALTNTKGGGVVVNVVGPGTPAAIAGIQVGDTIKAVSGVPVLDADDFTDYLFKNTKPGDTIAIDLERGSTTAMTVNARLIRRPLELIRPEDLRGSTAVNPTQAKSFGRVGPPSYRTTLRQLGSNELTTRDEEFPELPSLYEGNWKVEERDDAIVFSTELSADELKQAGGESSLRLTKTFRLATKEGEHAEQAYHLAYKLAIENTGKKAQSLAYRQEGPNGLPLEGWWYAAKLHPGWGGAGARDVAFFRGTHKLLGLPEMVTNATNQIKENNPPTTDLFMGYSGDRNLGYVVVDTQYFASGLLPGNALAELPLAEKRIEVAGAYAEPLNVVTDKKWQKTTNTSYFLDSPAKVIEPGQSLTDEYLIFAGPKDAKVLPQYGLKSLIEYGWFGWVSGTLSFVLHTLYDIIHNYGLSIILLTVVVRLCLLPFSIRQARSAAVMQQMAPEIAKIKEKYAGDMEKQAVAQRELFAKHGFNPMGGCLLMFAQLPIFMGLYRCLATDIHLREAALIPGVHWASNLAGPDQLLRWKAYLWPMIADEAHGWLGPYCNVLPLITIALFMIQQKLFSPPAVDEEQKLQQKIMNFMTIFMGVMFYKVPAGLCIYFITSSLWGIGERKLLKTKPAASADKPFKPPEKPDRGGDDRKASDAEPGFLERIMSLADAQLKEAKSTGPRKKAKK
jgi:YidC/Oxa1 family membrane protein insertase